MIIKDSKHIKINTLNLLWLIFNKVNGYVKEIYENKYLTLIPINESKEKIKKNCEELWSNIRDLIRPITKNSDAYDEKYMEIKTNSDDKLPLNDTIGISSMMIVVTTVFYENNKYYHQFP